MLGLTRQMVSPREIWGITGGEEYRKAQLSSPPKKVELKKATKAEGEAQLSRVGKIEKSKKVHRKAQISNLLK